MYLLFDIGGTKTRIAFSEDGKTFEDPEIFLTPENFEEGIDLIKSKAKKVIGGRNLIALAGGIAGSLSKDKKEILILPNIPKWQGKPIVSRLSNAFNLPIFLENDAALVALGEAIYGSGKGNKVVAYITLSTGVGGARIVDGKIDVNSFGFEPGHQIIDFEEAYCSSCGTKGELTDYVSGKSLENRLHKKPQDVKDEKVWDELARILAYGINNVIVFWSPDVVILGGSMMNESSISIEKVRSYLKGILTIFPKYSDIKSASLGDVGGLYGALVLANSKKDEY
ncbi:MAG: ROK family protein [Patescibacteria group bacterium]